MLSAVAAACTTAAAVFRAVTASYRHHVLLQQVAVRTNQIHRDGLRHFRRAALVDVLMAETAVSHAEFPYARAAGVCDGFASVASLLLDALALLRRKYVFRILTRSQFTESRLSLDFAIGIFVGHSGRGAEAASFRTRGPWGHLSFALYSVQR